MIFFTSWLKIFQIATDFWESQDSFCDCYRDRNCDCYCDRHCDEADSLDPWQTSFNNFDVYYYYILGKMGDYQFGS